MKHRIDVFHDYNKFGNGEHPEVKKLAETFHMECDGGGMVIGSGQYGSIYYGTKKNVLAFGTAVQDAGFRVELAEF